MSHMDILMERLKGYEETHLLELLDLTSEVLVARFRDVIFEKREQLYGEVELFFEPDNDEEVFAEQFGDGGFQIEDYENE